jgi:hypothetical protein
MGIITCKRFDLSRSQLTAYLASKRPDEVVCEADSALEGLFAKAWLHFYADDQICVDADDEGVEINGEWVDMKKWQVQLQRYLSLLGEQKCTRSQVEAAMKVVRLAK